MYYLLESPVFNVQSALDAVQYGVHRLELCANFPEGGETPSIGMLKYLKEKVNVPIMVMIRPRGGDFFYSPEEIQVMEQDIQELGKAGADGFVFGVLDQKGHVNTKACERLLDCSQGLPSTFHRAFDACARPKEALEDIIALGFTRILTSGAKNSVSAGIDLIEQLMNQAGNRILIMPGGGSQPDHVQRLKKNEYFREIHASCKTKVKSGNLFENPDVSFTATGDDYFYHLGIDAGKVGEFLKEFEEA